MEIGISLYNSTSEFHNINFLIEFHLEEWELVDLLETTVPFCEGPGLGGHHHHGRVGPVRRSHP